MAAFEWSFVFNSYKIDVCFVTSLFYANSKPWHNAKKKHKTENISGFHGNNQYHQDEKTNRFYRWNGNVFRVQCLVQENNQQHSNAHSNFKRRLIQRK